MDDVNKKALSSSKYLILFGILSAVMSFGVSALIGRISPEILGKYSLIVSFLNLTTTVVCMGGATILSRYIIREKSTINRSRFFFTYCYLTILILIIFSILLIFVPSAYEVFVGNTGQDIKFFCIFFMMPIYTAVTVVSYYLMSILESKISKIMGTMYVLGMFVICIFAYFFLQKWYINNFYLITFITILCMNILALYIGIHYIRKNKLLFINREALKPLIYKSAIIFTICTLGQAILSYLSTNFDKLFLGNLNGMGQLGYYQAILQIVLIVELIPNLLGNVTIPYFSAIIEKEDNAKIRSTYMFIERMVVLFIGTVVFGLIAVSKIILNIYGEEYLTYYPALVMLLASKLISSRGFLNTPMLVNLDKNIIRLINSVLQVLLQIIIMVVAIPKMGIYGAIIAKMIGTVFAQIIPQIVVAKSKYKIIFSKQYWVATFIVSVLTLIILFLNLNTITLILSSFIAYVLFWICGGYSFKELRGFLKNITKH